MPGREIQLKHPFKIDGKKITSLKLRKRLPYQFRSMVETFMNRRSPHYNTLKLLPILSMLVDISEEMVCEIDVRDCDTIAEGILDYCVGKKRRN